MWWCMSSGSLKELQGSDMSCEGKCNSPSPFSDPQQKDFSPWHQLRADLLTWDRCWLHTASWVPLPFPPTLPPIAAASPVPSTSFWLQTFTPLTLTPTYIATDGATSPGKGCFAISCLSDTEKLWTSDLPPHHKYPEPAVLPLFKSWQMPEVDNHFPIHWDYSSPFHRFSPVALLNISFWRLWKPDSIWAQACLTHTHPKVKSIITSLPTPRH